MASCHVHIMGASGSGTTTLGRALATELAIPHHDTDDYYWKPTHPPFTEKRPVVERLRLMEEIFVPRTGWVLSGSLIDWGDPLIPGLDLVIFVRTTTAVRLTRLHRREERTFGSDAVAPGGWRHDATQAFLDWASGYDLGVVSRTLQRHEAWLAELPCPVLRVDGGRPIAELVAEVMARLRPDRVTAPDPGARSPIPTEDGVPPA